jgi:hypothetical protein
MRASGRSASVQAASAAAAAAAALTSRAVTAGTASRVVAGAMKEASEGPANVEDVEDTAGDSPIGEASEGSTAGELARLKRMVASLTAESNKAKKATAEANKAKESAAEANKAKESVSEAIVTKQPDAGTAEVLEALHLIYFQ